MDGGREEWDWKVFFSDRGVYEVSWVGGVGWGSGLGGLMVLFAG